MRLAQRRLQDPDLTTFVGSDHGFAPQFAAIDASKVLVDLGLLSRPQTSNCRPATGGDDRQGEGVLGRRHRADLPQPRRPRPRERVPAGRRRRRGRHGRRDQGGLPRPRGPERLDGRRRARGLGRDRPGLHQGRGPADPERRGRHGRHGAPDAHGRPRGLLRAAVPVRRGDAGHADRPLGLLRPARLRARRAGPRHATRTCAPRSSPAGPRSAAASRGGVRSIDLAPDGGVPARRPRAAAQPGHRAARPAADARAVHAAVHRRAERLPRPARADHHARSTGSP